MAESRQKTPDGSPADRRWRLDALTPIKRQVSPFKIRLLFSVSLLLSWHIHLRECNVWPSSGESFCKEVRIWLPSLLLSEGLSHASSLTAHLAFKLLLSRRGYFWISWVFKSALMSLRICRQKREYGPRLALKSPDRMFRRPSGLALHGSYK